MGKSYEIDSVAICEYFGCTFELLHHLIAIGIGNSITTFVHHHFEQMLLQELEISVVIHTNPYTFKKAKFMLGWVHSLNVFPMDCYPNISSGFREGFSRKLM